MIPLVRLTALLALALVPVVMAKESETIEKSDIDSKELRDQPKLDDVEHFYSGASIMDYCSGDPGKTLGISEFYSMPPTAKKATYNWLKYYKDYRCMKDANGSDKYFGVPAVTKTRDNVREILGLSGVNVNFWVNKFTPFGANAQTCVVMPTSDVWNSAYGHRMTLRKMKAGVEEARMGTHHRRVIRNKQEQFSEDGRTQLGCETKICFEMAYSAVYSEYVVGVMLDKQMTNSISRQQILNDLGIYDEHIAHVSRLVGMGEEPDDVWREHMARNAEEAKRSNGTETEDFQPEGKDEDVKVNSASRPSLAACHPVCKLLVAKGTQPYFHEFNMIAYQSCCRQCPGTWCNRKSKAASLIERGHADVTTIETINGVKQVYKWGLNPTGIKP